MKLKEFNYDIAPDLIAQTPLTRREQARLLVVNRNDKSIRHDTFANIGAYLPENSVLTFNDSKVIPARLLGRKQRTDGKVEVFLLKRIGANGTFEALLRPLRKIKEGDAIVFRGSRMTAEVIDRDKRIVRFNRKDVVKPLSKIGQMPLPPYIKRPATARDRKFYQTVYARRAGSVASPTAGLHFTKRLLNSLKRQGHELAFVTLHVNYATFKPVEEPDIRAHKMHSEAYTVGQNTWARVRRAKARGKKIVAVGTTSCRVLEAAAGTGRLKGTTDLFLYPGCRFAMTDILVTNFHQPFSSLLMLVYAFGGTALMKKAYREAIRKKYRFYSYGDGMIII